MNRLAHETSPYLRSHAENPVDWWPWGEAAFAEAARRNVPVLISIGYATCHWCHVMARESFSNPATAAYLNEHFVAIKVDREEHPEVDGSYLIQASAFTQNLGWPLNVFATPAGRTFFAGTYFPPQPGGGQPAFGQVLAAVTEAWTERRDQIEDQGEALRQAITESAAAASAPTDLLDQARLGAIATALPQYEDRVNGGFGAAPKFPVVPVLQFLLDQGGERALDLAERTLMRLADSPLRDSVDGGFFRYATLPDWSEPHYERMLYDNAQLLRAYAALAIRRPAAADRAEAVADGIARFLLQTMAVDGGFASGQDSESVINGVRVEGGYYQAEPTTRAGLNPPALDDKVLTGWNGLAIEALAFAGFRLGRAEWVDVAATAADTLWDRHARPNGRLIRASLGGVASNATAVLEDYGMLASALLQLAEATGELRFAERGRAMVDACIGPAGAFEVPGGGDPVLAGFGLAVPGDPSEGAYPSGLSAMSLAALRLYRLTDQARYRQAAAAAAQSVADLAGTSPISFGAALSAAVQLAAPVAQLLVIGSAADTARAPRGAADTARAPRGAADQLREIASGWLGTAATVAVATPMQAAALAEAGFELFAKRTRPAAYLCEAFTCRLPITDPTVLAAALAPA